MKCSYAIAKNNQGRLPSIEPFPKPLEEILKERSINESDIIEVEAIVAIMFSMGLSVLKNFFPNADISNHYK